ncbi:hypothetical protein FQN53_001733 [Emmonsiellopsis sp. PD_33]|nr:hypothetical protein FQN53_001733 [Emmonsiellopsis sp. PD_33]
MDNRVIDLYLSTKLMDDPDGMQEKNTRLRQFVHHDQTIQSAECPLSEDDETTQGIVFKVEIEGNTYCLKLFKQWTWTPTVPVRERTQMLHSPFACESRAFARLIDHGHNGTWAVKCHGWMQLTERQFAVLESATTTAARTLNNSTCSQQQPLRFTCTRWAIIKDYISNPFRTIDIPEINRKLSIPKSLLIKPEDFYPRNFRESFFVDLGSTQTYPCPPFWSEFSYRWFYETAPDYVRTWEEG